MLKPDYQVDIEWLMTISHDLERFSSASVSNQTYMARCPICGDSQKSKRKTRLYIYTKKGTLNFDCKNCGAHGSFWTFMKEVFPHQFEQYKKDQMLKRLQTSSSPVRRTSTTSAPPKPKKRESAAETKSLEGCTALSLLKDSHPAIKYLKGRHFEKDQIDRLYYSDNFKVTAEALSEDPLSPRFPDEPRIVIPFFSTEGDIEMVQGRSLDPESSLRYISIKRDEDVDKIFGKEYVDRSRTVYCVEGPLDALFVDNCVATCDSSLHRSTADVLIWDNQPRSKEICDLIEQAIDNRRSVVIWPDSPDAKLDINDMIKLGITREELMKVIKQRTFSGLRAKLEFNRWKKQSGG
jgi:hypothetical protein